MLAPTCRLATSSTKGPRVGENTLSDGFGVVNIGVFEHDAELVTPRGGQEHPSFVERTGGVTPTSRGSDRRPDRQRMIDLLEVIEVDQ